MSSSPCLSNEATVAALTRALRDLPFADLANRRARRAAYQAAGLDAAAAGAFDATAHLRETLRRRTLRPADAPLRSTLPTAGAARIAADMARVVLHHGVETLPPRALLDAGFSPDEIHAYAYAGILEATLIEAGRRPADLARDAVRA